MLLKHSVSPSLSHSPLSSTTRPCAHLPCPANLIHTHIRIGTVYVDRLEEESDKEAVKPKLQELAKAYKDANNGDAGAPDLKF